MECKLCRDTGWLFDAKDRRGIVTMEVYPCLIPDCKKSGQRIELLSIDTMRFTQVSKHPSDGYIMSLGGNNGREIT
uniref:Uncharacterized protein n=1 Tax=viral metagenome TaxID=1070528 RepID=A0A6M3JW30_9ZZZZ